VSRLQTEERWPDQFRRLRSMTDPAQQTWDLSPNDVAAIAAAVKRIEDCENLVMDWRAKGEIAESPNRAELWNRCANALWGVIKP
jgi:hypothetical protein